MSEKLKACPFCGSEARIKSSWCLNDGYVAVGCGSDKGCPAANDEQDEQGGFSCEFDNVDDATRNWNTRPIEDALLARAEAAEARVAELEAEVKRLKTAWMDENILRCPDCGAEYITISGNAEKCGCLQCGGVAVMVEETRR